MKRLINLVSIGALGMTLAACGGDDGPADVTMVSSMNPAKYVANTLTVPQMRSDYAIDLNGDGKVDNQLGNIIGALSAQNLNTQDSVDMALKNGSVLLLLTQTSADATYMQDSASGVTAQVGNTQANPDFTGAGSFTINSALRIRSFAGRI